MRILIVTPHRQFSGGVESVNRMLQVIFEQEGHRVDYLTADGTAAVPGRALRRLVGAPAVTALRYRQLSADDYDLIIANGEFAWGVDHPRLICIFHGSYLGLRDYLKRHLSPREYLSLSWQAQVQRMASDGKYVVAVSGFLENILRRQGVQVARVIDNCVDTQWFSPGILSGASRYLFVGSYNRYAKGFDVLEELARRGMSIDCVTDRHPGPGLGHLGAVPFDEMPQVYRRYRAVIFPSRFESVGLVPLEAMSCGIPVVMTNVGVGHELRGQLPQFVVDVDASDLVEQIEDRLDAIESHHRHHSEAARQYVLQRHSWARFRQQWLDLLQERATTEGATC